MAKPKPVTDCSLASDEDLLRELFNRHGGMAIFVGLDPRTKTGKMTTRWGQNSFQALGLCAYAHSTIIAMMTKGQVVTMEADDNGEPS